MDELPIWNWEKIKATEDLNYLKIDYKSKWVQDEVLNHTWELLEDEYVTKFIINNDLKDTIRKKTEAISLRIDAILLDDKSLNNLARATAAEIIVLESNREQINTEETVVILEKYLGFRLDTRKLTVLKYFMYIDLFIKESKKLAKSNG